MPHLKLPSLFGPHGKINWPKLILPGGKFNLKFLVDHGAPKGLKPITINVPGLPTLPTIPKIKFDLNGAIGLLNLLSKVNSAEIILYIFF